MYVIGAPYGVNAFNGIIVIRDTALGGLFAAFPSAFVYVMLIGDYVHVGVANVTGPDGSVSTGGGPGYTVDLRTDTVAAMPLDEIDSDKFSATLSVIYSGAMAPRFKADQILIMGEPA